MTFRNDDLSDAPSNPKRIAVIGSGIAGVSAAWSLSRAHDVVVYEKDARLGGHSNTIDAPLPSGGSIPVDTGFIVYNVPSYPNFTAFLDHLGVATEQSDMSFGVSMNDGAFEYSGQTLSSVFARRRNAASPSFWRMLRDIPRFHRDARATLDAGFCEYGSLGDFVSGRGYSRGFREHFLKPMAAAIWSTPEMKVFEYPAFAFLRFFENHGLLQVLNLPVWRTVTGGSRSYVRRASKSFESGIRLSTPVTAVRRSERGVYVRDARGGEDLFDAVVIAAHADAASAMVVDQAADEARILSSFPYQQNRAVVHMDPGQMPVRKRAWSSWNYIGDADRGAISYWMNRLQNLSCAEDIFITLNPKADIREDQVIAAFDYDHPMFNAATEQAQKDIWSIQGRGGIYYAGAHLGHGFHEDGLQAGLAAAEAAGAPRRPWEVENESGRLQLPEGFSALGPLWAPSEPVLA